MRHNPILNKELRHNSIDTTLDDILEGVTKESSKANKVWSTFLVQTKSDTLYFLSNWNNNIEMVGILINQKGNDFLNQTIIHYFIIVKVCKVPSDMFTDEALLGNNLIAMMNDKTRFGGNFYLDIPIKKSCVPISFRSPIHSRFLPPKNVQFFPRPKELFPRPKELHYDQC